MDTVAFNMLKENDGRPVIMRALVAAEADFDTGVQSIAYITMTIPKALVFAIKQSPFVQSKVQYGLQDCKVCVLEADMPDVVINTNTLIYFDDKRYTVAERRKDSGIYVFMCKHVDDNVDTVI